MVLVRLTLQGLLNVSTTQNAPNPDLTQFYIRLQAPALSYEGSRQRLQPGLRLGVQFLKPAPYMHLSLKDLQSRVRLLG